MEQFGGVAVEQINAALDNWQNGAPITENFDEDCLASMIEDLLGERNRLRALFDGAKLGLDAMTQAYDSEKADRIKAEQERDDLAENLRLWGP